MEPILKVSGLTKTFSRQGQADFTAGEPAPGGTARQMVQALSEGADVCRMTLSSDAFGSQPRFDA